MKRRNQTSKRMETICKMAERKSISGLYITYGLQSLIHRTTNPKKLDATVISARFYPYITLEKVNGEKEMHPIVFGN